MASTRLVRQAQKSPICNVGGRSVAAAGSGEVRSTHARHYHHTHGTLGYISQKQPFWHACCGASGGFSNRSTGVIAPSAVLDCARAHSPVIRLSSLHRALRRPRHTTNVAAAATLHVSAGSGGGNTGRRQPARGIALLACPLVRCLSLRELRPGTSEGKGGHGAGRNNLGRCVCARSITRGFTTSQYIRAILKNSIF